MMRGTLIGAVMALSPTMGLAEGFDGNKLAELCQATSNMVFSNFTLGFALGVSTTMPTGGRGPTFACIPTAASAVQVRDVLCNYVAQHPEIRHYNASPLAQRAMINAWPCPQ